MTPAEKIAQRTAALELANTTRLRMAKFKRDIAGMTYGEGLAMAAEILENEDAGALEGLKLMHLLCSVQKIGRTKAMKLAKQAGIYGPDRPIRTLTRRQRVALAALLRQPRSVWPYLEDAA